MSKNSKRKQNMFESVVDTDSEDRRSLSVDAVDAVETLPTGKLTKATRYLRQRLWLVGAITILSLGALGAGLKYLEEDAQRQKLLKPKDRSALSVVNPFLSAPSPTPTPQLSKELIWAGSRLLAVEDANANAAPPADLAVWRPSNGTWYVIGGVPGSTQVEFPWGLNGDKPVPGDYDGDGKTDFSVFRISENKWYVFHSSDNSISTVEWGLNNDLLAQADYDGDGKTDRAIFRKDSPTTGLASWFVIYSSNGSFNEIQYGLTNDLPAPADYDGDGKADFGVWRGSDRKFYSVNSSNQSEQTIEPNFNPSSPSWTVVSGDYDGDGKADYGVFDSNAANWYVRSSISGTFPTNPVVWGSPSDTPVHNDYDGDGKCDIATWRNSNGYWYIRQSSLLGQSGELRSVQWGLPGDIPVPAYFRR